MATLQLGCGHNPLEGAVNHDRIKHAPYVDVAWDLDKLPWPWEDGQWDKVIALDVMEHLRLDIREWLNECWRIIKPEGELVLRLPAWDNPESWRDPTHRRVFQEETFYYWDRSHPLHTGFGSIYFAEDQKWWKVLNVTRQGDIYYQLRKEVD